MKCPKCKSAQTRTRDSREKEGFRWRRKLCSSCGMKWTTYEITLTETVKAIPPEIRQALMPAFLDLCCEEVEKKVAAKLARLLNEMTLDANTPL